MYQELQNMMLSSSFVYMNARMGCTHLTVDVLLSLEEAAALKSGGSKGLLEAAVSRGTLLFPENTFQGPRGKLLVQCGQEASIIGGAFDVPVNMSVTELKTSAPGLKNLVPFAVLPEERCHFGVYGSNMNGYIDMLICRRGSTLPSIEVVQCGRTDRNEDYIEFVLPCPAEGLHFVEVQRGSLLSATVAPFLVIDNVDAVNEIRQLEYDTTGVGAEREGVASFLRMVGVVLDFLRKKDVAQNNSEEVNEGDDEGLPGYISYIEDTPQFEDVSKTAQMVAPLAQRVVALCVLRGWPALLRLVLPALVPPGTAPDVVIEEFKSFSNDNLSLVHLAVLSRCPEVVNVLAEWSQSPAVQYTWRCEGAHQGEENSTPTSVAADITPLHLAALLDDNGRMAAALTSLFLGDFELWSLQQRGNGGGADGDGSTAAAGAASLANSLSPADFAVLVKNYATCSWLKKNGVPLNTLAAEVAGEGTATAHGGGDAGGSRQPPPLVAASPATTTTDLHHNDIPDYLINPMRTKSKEEVHSTREFHVDELILGLNLDNSQDQQEGGSGAETVRHIHSRGWSVSKKEVVVQALCVAAATGLALYVRNVSSLSPF
jgi:hypothetical protein